MTVSLITLVLNEIEWLPRLVEQHLSWPGLSRWIFVEAADRAYALSNPDMVNDRGLSVDGTSKFLRELALSDSRIVYVPYGHTSVSGDKAQGKTPARQHGLMLAGNDNPEFVICLDADEAYTHEDQGRLLDVMRKDGPRVWAWTFPRREIWRPPSIADQRLFQYEVKGGFWDIPCCHWWRWAPDLRYGAEDHNVPVRGAGTSLRCKMAKYHRSEGMPELIHLGFAASEKTRVAKNSYYADRGEAVDPKRSWYVESRAAWKNWKVGDTLPRGAEVVPYKGQIPEVYR